MPGMNNTGPFGNGQTGRGMGPCGGGQAGHGRGIGFRRGGGEGWGIIRKISSPGEEKEFLEQQKGWLETQLEAVTHRLQEIEKTKESE